MANPEQFKIICIFTNQTVYQLAKQVVQEQGLPYPVYFSPMSDAVQLAREQVAQGAELIISRGGVATVLQQSVNVPVISVKYSFTDFAISLEEAKKISNKVAVVSYGAGIAYAQRIERFLDMNITMAEVNDPSKVPETLEKLQEDGIEVIVGGYSSTTVAKKMGMQAVSMNGNRYSIIEALELAQKTLSAVYEQKSKLQTVTAVLSTATTGMLVMDKFGAITNINSIAQNILKVNERDVLGKNYQKVFPHPKMVEATLKGETQRQKIIQHNMEYLVVSSIPVILDQKIIGAVLNLQGGTEIQNLENKLRIQTIGNGHIARNEFEDIIGTGTTIREVKERARIYAQVDSTVMLYGESGTGKELFAQSIHNASRRKNRPFVAVNCAALPEALLESELFGYAKGAFTGARSDGKAGIFEIAHQGTIFLDEIGEMPLALQSRLLRVLQEKEVVRLGSTKVLPVNVRILAATNRNLIEEVEKGNFRQDLYYRLCVLVLTIPPLRQRKEDIEPLSKAFASRFARQYGKTVDSVSLEALEHLRKIDFPGNIRELSNLVERAVILCKGSTIDEATLREALAEEFPQPKRTVHKPEEPVKHPAEQEAEQIRQILESCDGRREQAAQLLGISRATLWRKMKKYEIE